MLRPAPAPSWCIQQSRQTRPASPVRSSEMLSSPNAMFKAGQRSPSQGGLKRANNLRARRLPWDWSRRHQPLAHSLPAARPVCEGFHKRPPRLEVDNTKKKQENRRRAKDNALELIGRGHVSSCPLPVQSIQHSRQTRPASPVRSSEMLGASKCFAAPLGKGNQGCQLHISTSCSLKRKFGSSSWNGSTDGRASCGATVHEVCGEAASRAMIPFPGS
jgi:hypothetical protein